MRAILISALFLLISGEAFGQYFHERSLQQSYEEMDFFYRPTLVNPFALGGFTGAAPGLINDPLLNLGINPANGRGIAATRDYLYVDFRSTQRVGDGFGGAYPMYWGGGYLRRYPIFFTQQRREITPLVSAAYLARPVRQAAPGLLVGITYQLAYQDEPYYSIPMDVYRQTVGADYAGRALASPDAIPIVDRYRGDDEIHHSGHFANAFLSYEFSPVLRTGIRAGRTVFSRDGIHGTLNAWENAQWGNYQSFWNRSEMREQSYDHWDFNAGLEANFTPRTTLGISGGYLTGDGGQELIRRDSSSFQSTHNSGSHRSAWGHRADQEWNNTGSTFYGSVYFRQDSGPRRTTILYQGNHTSSDLEFASTLADTSFYLSNYYQGSHNWSEYLGYSAFADTRRGDGTRTMTTHRGLAGMQWHVHRNLELDMGLHLTARHTRTNTTEDVTASGHSHYEQESSTFDHRRTTAFGEVKQLRWTFDAHQLTLQVPFYLVQRLSKYFDLIGGINRSMTFWKIEDEVLAIFDYRETMTDGEFERRENFGERYRQPRERRTDVLTTFLAGVDVKPADAFNIRFLLSPEIRSDVWGDRFDFQWWIGIRVTP